MAVGVSVVLVAVVLILISVTVCLRQRKKQELLITTENAAYGTSRVNMELKDNIAYTSAATGEETKDDDAVYDNIDEIIYDYVSWSDVTATPSNVPVAVNQAYGVVQS